MYQDGPRRGELQRHTRNLAGAVPNATIHWHSYSPKLLRDDACLRGMHPAAPPVVPVICHAELGPYQEHLPLPQVHTAVVAHPSVDDRHPNIAHYPVCVAACGDISRSLSYM